MISINISNYNGGDSNFDKQKMSGRYEFNKKYLESFDKNGMIFSGESDDGRRMEVLEIPSHKFFLGVQFHPEFNSRPGFPEESFKAFISAAGTN